MFDDDEAQISAMGTLLDVAYNTKQGALMVYNILSKCLFLTCV